MLQRFVYLLVGGTAVLAGISFILRYFSDIQPVAAPEPQSVWRFEAAFLLTAAQWIAFAIAAVSIVVLLFRSGAAPARFRQKPRKPPC